MKQRADAEPEERLLIETRLARQRAREIGDALAMALRVVVLRFDRFTPAPHDVEEVALEPRCLPVNVR